MGKTFVYRFDQGHKDMRDLLGGKEQIWLK